MKSKNKNAGRAFGRSGSCAYKVFGSANADYKKIVKITIAAVLILSFLAFMFFTPYNGKLFADSKIKVFLDAGHGGHDPGAVWYGYQEKVANLDIALRVKSKLEANGFSVAMTRTSDITKSLDERVAMANSSGADIFVAIHNNASISPYAHGTETFWCANGVAGSSQLASLIQSNLVSSIGRANRGVKTANFRVIKFTTMPAALVEGVFMSNQTESDLLKTAEFREKMADGIYKGIKKFAEGINKASSGGSSSGSQTSETTSATTTPVTGSQNQNTYSDTSGTNSSGFTVKVNLPENGARLFSQFEIRGWSADLRGTPAKKLTKLEIYKAPERNEANLLGKIEDFETNVLGSEGVLDGGWSLALDVEKLSEGENILYIYAYDKDKNYSIGNLRVNAVKSGDFSQINLNPIAVLGGPYNGEINTDVKFNGTGSYDPDGIIAQYIWDFGDGNTSDLAKPVHKYTEKGTYTVTLTVKDGQGKSSATVSTTAAIIDPSEASQTTETENSVTANAGDDKLVNAGESATFDASASIINISGDTTVSYLWDWDGDGKFDQTADTAVIKHTFETAGIFEVALKVMLSDGNQSTDTVKVTVNSIPTADAGGPYSAEAGKQITLDGSKSTDSDGTIINYLWDFGDGTTGSGMKPSHVYTEPGDYTVKLTVVDDRNAPSTTVSVTVEVTEEEIETSQSSETPGTLAQESTSGTEDTAQKTTTKSSTSETSQDTTQETTSETTAPNIAPTADAGGPYSAKVDEQITLDGSKSSDSDGQISEYIWDFGDGTTGTGQKPSKTYTEAGTYTVKLTVKDDKGLASSVAQATATIAEKVTQPQYPVNTSIITNSTSFIGYHEVTVDQLVNVFIKRGSSQVDRARRIAPIYIQYGKLFNIRADLAWAQMIHETGLLAYTGDVKPNQNNFCGLGATGGGVPGHSFATEELGVIAHYAHLAWYYYPGPINEYTNQTYDPRYFSWSFYTGNTTVGFLNGKWAPSATYTDKILLFANQVYGK